MSEPVPEPSSSFGAKGKYPHWVEWLFQSRRTGRITIAQWPNIPLWVFIVAALIRAVLHPGGWPGTVLNVVATGSLVIWAAIEVGWGVNSWRRFLGAAVITGQVVLLIIQR